MRTSSEAKKTEKPDAQLQVGDATDVDFGRVWHLPLCLAVTLGIRLVKVLRYILTVYKDIA